MYVKCIKYTSSLLQPGIVRMCGDMVLQTADGGRVFLWKIKPQSAYFYTFLMAGNMSIGQMVLPLIQCGHLC